VYYREIMNKMYTPNIYLNARLLSNWLLQLFVPFIYTVVIFWAIDIDESIENLLMFLFASLLMNMEGIMQGYALGVMFDDDDNCR
jgi:hypothetical protein